MFEKAELKSYNFLDNNKIIGLVNYNPQYNLKADLTRPFIRNGKRLIESIGRVNYQVLDNFIIQSLNDYYSKISLIKKEAERKKYLDEYGQLYFLWQKVTQAKQTNDINLNNYYDDLVYRLYLLGYRN